MVKIVLSTANKPQRNIVNSCIRHYSTHKKGRRVTGRHFQAKTCTKPESILRFPWICSTAYLFFSSLPGFRVCFWRCLFGGLSHLYHCFLVVIITVSILPVFTGHNIFFSCLALLYFAFSKHCISILCWIYCLHLSLEALKIAFIKHVYIKSSI